MKKIKQRKRAAISSYISKDYKAQVKNSLLIGDSDILENECDTVPHNQGVGMITRNMKDLLTFTKNGIGLAANQIGSHWRIIAIYPYRKRMEIMINPVIIKSYGGLDVKYEGCLSYPGVRIKITRPHTIVLTYEDEARGEYTKTIHGMEARIIQHEVDHINEGHCKLYPVWKNNNNKFT